ncbi:hypothetical protein ABIE64_003494 [Thalassospira sp. MBR-102]|uniref:hypothetical protein n=1 Tax=Thalassospira sp. MBR-102 TaxID=3156466 RepID=UPI00339229B7
MTHTLTLDMIDQVTPVYELAGEFPKHLVDFLKQSPELATKLDVLPASGTADRTLVAKFSDLFLERLVASGAVNVEDLIAIGIVHKDFSLGVNAND